MSTREKAVQTLGAYLSQPVATVEAAAEFCAQFEIRPYRDGWVFQTLPKRSRGESTPLWWMVVGEGVYGFLFFKMANAGAYRHACALDASR